MSKRDMPWPEIGARVEVEFVGVGADSWREWIYRGQNKRWICLEPVVEPRQSHEGEGRYHWFPLAAITCMVETEGEG